MTIARSVLFNLYFFGFTFILTLIATVLRFVAPGRVLGFARFWARSMIWGARAICGIRMEVSGQENLPPGPAVIASRHESAFDIVAWLVLVPSACFVVKKERVQIPLFGGLIVASQMIPVDREAGGSAIRALLRGGARAKKAGRQIVIFPEGTRAEPGIPLPLHPGVAALATHTGLPIVPVMTDSGRCWGKRAFRKRAGTIHIAIRPALVPNIGRDALFAALRTEFAVHALLDRAKEP